MTYLDPQPINPYAARFKVIATLILLSEMGVIGEKKVRTAKVRTSGRGTTQPATPSSRAGSRLVRPPRSC